MYTLKDGLVIPGKQIGEFKVGMSFEQLCQITTDFVIESIGTSFEVIGENFRVSINSETQEIFHVIVWAGFRGAFDSWLGIGTKWYEVMERGIRYRDDALDLYYLENYPNMYFELCNNSDDWNESEATVVRIGIHVDQCEAFA